MYDKRRIFSSTLHFSSPKRDLFLGDIVKTRRETFEISNEILVRIFLRGKETARKISSLGGCQRKTSAPHCSRLHADLSQFLNKTLQARTMESPNHGETVEKLSGH